ncbi:Glycerol-3-phosphate dehydrogenase [Escovopsis weberi]|uniref:glycerol-3-phosphate dehydrogenase n=1 Tax=Escovopsis weberi TaxID=150374 RepID=A0A0M8MYK6_ESCWE|nr:Glycerol-3-phosphate dehydrogenase [Escovopsis weberi]
MFRASSSWKRPLLGLSAVAVGGAGIYATRDRRLAQHQPLVPTQRDAAGRIIPPSFPAIKSRAEQLAELRRHSTQAPDGSQEYDLVVIGAGATGSGIALDAVTRGLKVALLDRDDFAAGTSSKSTKLVHGGVRYLEKAVWNLDYSQLQLVMEALHERKTFLTISPHLSGSLPILLPLQNWWQAPYMWLGTKMYDLLAGSHGLESSYAISKSNALARFPLLRGDHMVGALVYYDGQHNDSRMNVSLALTASLYGATVLNYAEVTGLDKDARGRLCAVRVRDVVADGQEMTIRTKGVVNATGPFADAIERMDEPQRKALVAPASGAHVMLPGSLCPNGMGILDAATSDGRVVFVLPWEGYTLAGTTDNACAVERDPVARGEDVDFILKEVNKLLKPDAALGRSDVLAAWSGIRPLVRDPKAKNTESLVRSHLVTVSPSGLLTCAGGKWTTYRQMSEDAVDEAISSFGLKTSASALPDISGAGVPGIQATGGCITKGVPLLGAHGYSTSLASQLQERYPIADDIAHHLAANYGDRAWAVLAAAPHSRRIVPSMPFIEAEIRHGVRSEAACTATDVISRRTRIAFLDVNSALRALPRVIDVMAEELGWGPQRKEHEWTASMAYFRSMGLPEDKLGLSRKQVEALPPAASKPQSAAGGAVSGAELGQLPNGDVLV